VPEIVIKTGDLHSHDRIEHSQAITVDQFMGMVGAVSLLGFDMEVGERLTYNIELPNQIIVSIVSAGEVAYVEIEKITNEENSDLLYKTLTSIADEFKLNIIDTKEDFNRLCDKLSQACDWQFDQSQDSIKKLESLLKKY
jgi:ribosome recycling factor